MRNSIYHKRKQTYEFTLDKNVYINENLNPFAKELFHKVNIKKTVSGLTCGPKKALFMLKRTKTAIDTP